MVFSLKFCNSLAHLKYNKMCNWDSEIGSEVDLTPLSSSFEILLYNSYLVLLTWKKS